MIIRDIELRWPANDLAPDWFWKRCIPERLFVTEIRKLRIESENVGKINIYCNDKNDYSCGEPFDGVIDVNVGVDWIGLDTSSTSQLIDYFLCLMIRGTKIALCHLGVDNSTVDSLAERVGRSLAECSMPLGSMKLPFSENMYIRCVARPRIDFSACEVFLELTKGKTVIGKKDFCTTFPSFDLLEAVFKSLAWRDEYTVVAKFRVAGASDRRIFDRLNFDPAGFSGVVRTDRGEPLPPYRVVEPTFEINIADLVKRDQWGS